jgi:hypothetical protein
MRPTETEALIGRIRSVLSRAVEVASVRAGELASGK